MVSGKDDYVCLLKKTFYGLKQSPRQWYKKFHSFMISHNFNRCTYDSCVYLRRCDDEYFVCLLLYVDEMLIVAKKRKKVRRAKPYLAESLR